MKKVLWFFVIGLFLSYFSPYAQVEYKTIQSKNLQQDRNLKIQLPRNYKTNTNKSYPVIIVLDGDYLFEPVAGNVDYYSYWEDMPEAIVVGVMQKNRKYDVAYDPDRFLPTEDGAKFFEFIGSELLPLLSNNYRTVPFNIIVGHDLTANFINYYLFKDHPIFRGYINLSPDFAPEMHNRILYSLDRLDKKMWYYLATGTDDIKKLKEDNLSLNEQLKTLTNKNINYYFDNFEGATHYSLVGRAIPKALEAIFSVYQPISQAEYKEKLLKTEGSFYDYLVNKYETIQDLYGFENKVRVNDFMAVSSAIEEKKKWDDYKELGKLAAKEYPDTMMGGYFLGRYYEETGNSKRALKEYQTSFPLKEVSFITKDLMLEKANKIKADFGY